MLEQRKKSEISNLSSYLKKVDKEEQSQLKLSLRKEIVKIRSAGINDIENRKTIEKINETKNRLFEEINKIDKLLARLTKIKRRNESPIPGIKQDIITDYRAIKGMRKDVLRATLYS